MASKGRGYAEIRDGSLETDVSSRDSLETGFLKSRSRLGLDKNVSVSVSELRCLGLEKYVSVSESRLNKAFRK